MDIVSKNNRYLDFVQTRDLISLVNDNHVDNKLMEGLVYVYFGSIVKKRPKNCTYKFTHPSVVERLLTHLCRVDSSTSSFRTGPLLTEGVSG